jgi:hypothetical protein
MNLAQRLSQLNNKRENGRGHRAVRMNDDKSLILASFTLANPAIVRYNSPESRVQSPESRVQSPESRVQSPESRDITVF